MAATITTTQLAGILQTLRGATIISLRWRGQDPARYVRDRGRITKVSEFSGMVNARYDRKKAKSLGVDVADVDIAPAPWRERIGTSCLHRHVSKGTVYVEFYPASGSTEFTLDGTPCQRGDVSDMVKPSSGGGVNFRLVTLSEVTHAVIDREEYNVVPG